MESLTPSIKTWEYFVNWQKVFDSKADFEIALNKLNYLLGKADLKTEFNKLYSTNKDIIKAIPILLAVRESSIELFDFQTKVQKKILFDGIHFNSCDDYFSFIENTGLIKLFKNDGIKNLVDYVLGVEVGLDSNGRKNRGGTLMEDLVESYLKSFCNKHQFEYFSQVSAATIQRNWNINVIVDKSERRFDFAIFNPQSNKVKLFETNFYNGGGSKLKAVCGEFKDLYNNLKKQNIDFIWITDGLGWHTCRKPLEEVYNNNEYIFNLKMLENNILNQLSW